MSTAGRLGNSRDQQRHQTRDRILQAAIACFARRGFEAASMAQIAIAAGVKKALVQYHFTTKEQLWREAATRLWNERNERLQQFMAQRVSGNLSAALRPAFTALVEFTREQPEWLWFMFHEAQGNSARGSWLIEHFLGDDYALGQSFVRECQQQGLIREAPPLHLLHLISGALTYNLLVAPQTQKVTGVDLADQASITQQVDLLLELLSPPQAP